MPSSCGLLLLEERHLRHVEDVDFYWSGARSTKLCTFYCTLQTRHSTSKNWMQNLRFHDKYARLLKSWVVVKRDRLYRLTEVYWRICMVKFICLTSWGVSRCFLLLSWFVQPCSDRWLKLLSNQQGLASPSGLQTYSWLSLTFLETCNT